MGYTPSGKLRSATMANVARVLLGLLVTLLACGPSLSQAADEAARVSVLRVDASQPLWRDVYVSVADINGLPVTGLDRTAFTVTEDGNGEPLERVALAT